MVDFVPVDTIPNTAGGCSQAGAKRSVGEWGRQRRAAACRRSRSVQHDDPYHRLMIGAAVSQSRDKHLKQNVLGDLNAITARGQYLAPDPRLLNPIDRTSGSLPGRAGSEAIQTAGVRPWGAAGYGFARHDAGFRDRGGGCSEGIERAPLDPGPKWVRRWRQERRAVDPPSGRRDPSADYPGGHQVARSSPPTSTDDLSPLRCGA